MNGLLPPWSTYSKTSVSMKVIISATFPQVNCAPLHSFGLICCVLREVHVFLCRSNVRASAPTGLLISPQVETITEDFPVREIHSLLH